MNRKSRMMEQTIGAAQSIGATLPGVPLVEITADCRVLVENHKGILQYDTDQILIRVKYGAVLVEGMDLALNKMTKEQLLICGRITSVRLQRGASI